MNRNILALGLISLIAAACTLKVSDQNPKSVSLLGDTGKVTASIENGSITLVGTNLDNVTALALTQDGAVNAQLRPFTTHTRTLLTAGLPPALKLPGMLLISTAANTTEVPLNTLDSLVVYGKMIVSGDTTVSGTTDVGLTTVHKTCTGTSGFCQYDCPAGTKIVSGGCATGSQSIGLSANYPLSDTQWTCRPTNTTDVTTYLICARTTMNYQ